MPPAKLSRRKAVGLIAVTAGGGAFMPASVFAQGAGSLITGAGVCAIMPETTEGPFYFDPELERRDIRDGREGAALTVRLQLVDAVCQPIAGARIDIWHCDAEGHYSGYPGQGDGRDVDTSGEKFLRGVQRTDAEGIASFLTIYPGWYRGRTTHIHFKAFPDERSELTGQMFFPDELSQQIYRSVPPYNRRQSERDMFNERDGIARRAGPAAVAELRRLPSSYEAALIVAVAR